MRWIGIIAWSIFLGLCVYGWWWILIIILAPILGVVLQGIVIGVLLLFSSIHLFGFKRGFKEFIKGDFEKHAAIEDRLIRLRERRTNKNTK